MLEGSADMYLSYRFEHPSEAVYHYKIHADKQTKPSVTISVPAKVEDRKVNLAFPKQQNSRRSIYLSKLYMYLLYTHVILEL